MRMNLLLWMKTNWLRFHFILINNVNKRTPLTFFLAVLFSEGTPSSQRGLTYPFTSPLCAVTPLFFLLQRILSQQQAMGPGSLTHIWTLLVVLNPTILSAEERGTGHPFMVWSHTLILRTCIHLHTLSMNHVCTLGIHTQKTPCIHSCTAVSLLLGWVRYISFRGHTHKTFTQTYRCKHVRSQCLLMQEGGVLIRPLTGLCSLPTSTQTWKVRWREYDIEIEEERSESECMRWVRFLVGCFFSAEFPSPLTLSLCLFVFLIFLQFANWRFGTVDLWFVWNCLKLRKNVLSLFCIFPNDSLENTPPPRSLLH